MAKNNKTISEEVFSRWVEKLRERLFLPPNKYYCSGCNTMYEKGVSDEEAQKEFEDSFGVDFHLAKSIGGVVMYCDDCFKNLPEDLK